MFINLTNGFVTSHTFSQQLALLAPALVTFTALGIVGQAFSQAPHPKHNSSLNTGFLGSSSLFHVIASSTDSMYINLEDVILKFYKGKDDRKEKIKFLIDYADNKISKVLSEGYNTLANNVRAFENKMIMGREIIADSAFWVNKR